MFKPLFILASMTGIIALAQEKIPVNMTVTVDAVRSKQVPEVKGDDVLVFQGKERARLTEWTAYKGENAGLEPFVLIDDASGMGLGTQLEDLRAFVRAQPAATQIGIAYMHQDIAEITQNLTPDHDKAALALRLPFGNIAAGSSPYLALNDLEKKWFSCCVRREVVLVSSGVDPLGGVGPANQFVDAAIEHTQRAGVIVYAIYTPGAGHGGHSYWQLNWGQSHLAQLAEETGGESYMLGFGEPVSFEPYLRDIAEHFKHQYSAEFLVTPAAKPGLIPVRFSTETPNAEIVAAPRVYAAPARPASE